MFEHIIHKLLITVTAIVFFAAAPVISQQNSNLLIHGAVLTDDNIPLPFANVIVEGTETGTITENDGSFRLLLPPADSVKIRFDYIGYEPKRLLLTRKDLTGEPIIIVLNIKSLSFSPIEIIGKSTMEKSQLIEPSLRMIGIRDLQSVPSIGGGDVFRALQNFPGVNSSSELSNQLYVRGGTPDQNLVLINGIPVYQPFHLFGLSSSVDDAAIEYVRYYSGGFSVRFGDRMSSVLDIVTKPGSDTLTAYLDINLINAGGTVSGSLGDKLRWRVTGRRTYLDALSRPFGKKFPYYFYDLEGKISFLPNSHSLITLNTFVSEDDYKVGYDRIMYNRLYKYHPDKAIAYADSNQYRKINKSQLGWTNRLLSLRWMNRHSPEHMSEVTVYFSSLGQDLFNRKSFIPNPKASKSTRDEVQYYNREYYDYRSDAAVAETKLVDVGINLFHEWTLSKISEVSLGSGYSLRNLNYTWNTSDFDIISPYINIFMDFPPDSMNTNLELKTVYGFAEYILQPVKGLWLRGGLRLTNYSVYSKTAVDPRVNLTWTFNPNWTVKLSWGLFSQALSSATEYGFYNVASLYFPNKVNFPQAGHTLAGVIFDNRNNLLLDFSVYSKSFSNLLYYNKKGEAGTGKGVSHGIEFLSSYTPNSSVFIQLAYGYSITEKTQGGERFYPNYDQRHKINLRAGIQLKRNWMLNVNWSFTTGRPGNLATNLAYSADISGDDTGVFIQPIPFVLELPKNVFRYPAFHRLDISLTKTWSLRKGLFSGYFQILNLYNRANVVYYEDIKEEYKEVPDPDLPGHTITKPVYTSRQFNGFPFFPTIGISYAF